MINFKETAMTIAQLKEDNSRIYMEIEAEERMQCEIAINLFANGMEFEEICEMAMISMTDLENIIAGLNEYWGKNN